MSAVNGNALPLGCSPDCPHHNGGTSRNCSNHCPHHGEHWRATDTSYNGRSNR